MKITCIAAFLFFLSSATLVYAQNYLGNLSSDPNSASNRSGAGSPYKKNGLNNRYGTYGSPYSNKSANNPYSTQAPKLYDSKGNFRGNLNTNRYDKDSINNPYGKYGSKYSPDSLNNPYGAGSRFKKDSPNNRFGTGWKVYGQ